MGDAEPVTLPAPPPQLRQDAARMAFLAHLGELRRRLIWAVAAVALCTCVCFHFAPDLFEGLRAPLAALPTQKMIVLGPLEMFVTYIKVALVGGLLVASPVVLLQLWLFVAPGLYASEKRWLVPFVVTGSASFIGGAAFCFYVVLPTSFRYLVEMVPSAVEAHYSVSQYFSLILQLMLAFGGVFELPLVLTLLAAAGLVTAAKLRKFRKYWVVLAVFIGGVVTPTPDVLTQLMMAVPLWGFFEVGILGAALMERRSRRAARAARAA